MSDPLVSIIIPCYRQAQWLGQAVDSCLKQTYPAVEVIVVDDGSPDDVSGALKPFGERVRLLRQANQGPSVARNLGLQHARGAYVKFLDADDWLLPECVALQVNSLRGLADYVSIIGCRIHYEQSNRPDEDLFPPAGPWITSLCLGTSMLPHTHLIPIQQARRLGGFFDFYTEDYDFFFRMAIDGARVVCLNQIGCIYRNWPQSRSKQTETWRRGRLTVWKAHARQLLETSCPAYLAMALLRGYAHLVRFDPLRYQETDLFEQIARRILEQQEQVTQQMASQAYADLAILLRYLDRPVDGAERANRARRVRTVEQLALTLTDRLVTDWSIRLNPARSLLDLGEALIWVGRRRAGRKLLRRAGELAERKAIRAAIRLLHVLAGCLPGRLACTLWHCSKNVAEALRRGRPWHHRSLTAN